MDKPRYTAARMVTVIFAVQAATVWIDHLLITKLIKTYFPATAFSTSVGFRREVLDRLQHVESCTCQETLPQIPDYDPTLKP